MTTVIGIVSEEAQMAILCADRQATIGHHENREVPLGKASVRKLWIANDNMYSFGYAGTFDNGAQELATRMVDGNIDMQEVIKKGSFPELRELNIRRLGDQRPEPGSSGSFLLITRFDDKPSLYTCWPLGKVEPRGLTYIGSGATKVNEYIEARITLQKARDYLPPLGKDRDKEREGLLLTGLECLRFAQNNDPYSSGLDLVVATPNSLVDHFKDLQDDFKTRVESIAAHYRSGSN